ncbi:MULTISPECIES: sulfotransferase family protein [Aequorivita]|uniref:Sulfotransferase n=1 Tax=Aequorivita iocasae TaxID=2803865 RepID=A0ABX7DT54_9FLAO|nr:MULTISPECIES: sulfotransferase [Aequorivita]QQX76781.1 sulfotransferase [Aequorivita iocasae]UCA56253.1 sulfotransferase [Aequorivita sp. F7]
MSKIKSFIFVSGTGRSGTHLIGRTISSHPMIEGRIEDSYTFPLFTRIATTQDYNSPMVNYILKKLLFYRLKKISKNQELHILEKSHPSLWFVEDLLKNFSNSKFIGVYRDIEPTVNSMLNHSGVLNWYKKLPQDKPNRFLGITKENMKEFKNFSLEKKCALRWFSHINRLNEVQFKYPDNVLAVNYDDFIDDSEVWLEKISKFLQIDNIFHPEKFNINSKDKWRNNLTKEELEDIYKVKSEYTKLKIEL